MQRSAYEIVKNVILAKEYLENLSPQRHYRNCPKFDQKPEDCSCGADKENEKREKIKTLLDVQHLINFDE